MGLRITAMLPGLCSATVMALGLVLLLAGIKPGSAADYYLISLNTSKIGSDTIQFNTVQDPLGANNSSGIFGGLLSGLSGILTNISDAINGGLENIESDIMTNITKQLGIKDEYVIYVQNVCQGVLRDENNPKSIRITSCPSFKDATAGFANITNNIPSSVVIATINATVPLLEGLGSSLGLIENILHGATTANFAFILIGVISAGLVWLLSLASVILSRARIIVNINLFFSNLMLLAATTSAVILSVAVHTINTVVQSIGPILTIKATVGTKAIIITWVSVGLSLVPLFYWGLVWFVEFRRTMFVKKRRNPEDIGNYRAIIRETRRNLTLDKEGGKYQ